MKAQRDIASFVLRFTQEQWRDPQGEPRVQWRGHIRHVQGDEEVRFTDFAEAVTFIQRYLMQLTLNSLPGGDQMEQEKVLHESLKLWEQFATSYTNMMFDAMDRAMQQSEVLKEHMEKAAGQAMDQVVTQTGTVKEQVEEIVGQTLKQSETFRQQMEEVVEGALNQAFKGSETLKAQMEEVVGQALKGWQFPGQAAQGALVEALEELKTQIKTLGDKIDRLEKAVKAK